LLLLSGQRGALHYVDNAQNSYLQLLLLPPAISSYLSDKGTSALWQQVTLVTSDVTKNVS